MRCYEDPETTGSPDARGFHSFILFIADAINVADLLLSPVINEFY